MATLRILDVYRSDELVGLLYDEIPLKFEYADTWLNSPHAEPIAPNIGLQQKEHLGERVYAFFENLLPEGDIRQFLTLSQHAATVFSLLHAVAGDTAGALSLVPHGETPGHADYQPTTWAAIAASLNQPNSLPLIAQNEASGRVSVAGTQNKLLLAIMPDGTPAIPLGCAPSTHILKPDIRQWQNIWCSALNETFVMKLANAVGIGAAEVAYQPIVKACLVKRYDRHVDVDTQAQRELIRLHQLDFCQLDGKPSEVKYESEGGPTLARCGELLRQCNVPADDLKRLIQWVFFNLYVGNYDCHAKNLSILTLSIPGKRTRLAPFYDLMSTTLYAGLSRKFAFNIGGENRPSNIQYAHLNAMAEQLGYLDCKLKPPSALPLPLPLPIAEALAEAMLTHLHPVAADLLAVVESGTEHTFIDRLKQKISSTTCKLIERWKCEER